MVRSHFIDPVHAVLGATGGLIGKRVSFVVGGVFKLGATVFAQEGDQVFSVIPGDGVIYEAHVDEVVVNR